MTFEAKHLGNVEGLGEVYQVAAPLNHQLTTLVGVGIQTLVSPDEVAQIRLAGLSNYWSRTSMAPIGIKGGNTILFRSSPLMNTLMAAAAVSAHRQGKYFETSPDVYEAAKALAESQDTMAPEDKTAIILPQSRDFVLTPEMPESQFILRAQVKPYFEKFTKGTIPFDNLEAHSKNVATVNYLWLGGPRCGSGLDARDRGLDYHDSAFGVLRSGEARAQNSDLTLTAIKIRTPEIVAKYLEHRGMSGLADKFAELSDALLNGFRSQGKQI